MKPREYIIDNFSVTQASNGHVWVINNNPSGDDDFIRAHVQLETYKFGNMRPRRLTKRLAKRVLAEVRSLVEMEALNR